MCEGAIRYERGSPLPTAPRGQAACISCGQSATITLYESDPESPAERRWASYCNAHDPDVVTEREDAVILRLAELLTARNLRIGG
jgi:hypothetical protein